MSKKEPIRVAQIMGKWVGGGVEAVVMNYYRHIDRNKVQFDFICDNDSTCIPKEEIEKLGGKVILIPPYQKVFKYHKELKKVLTEGNYKIVHSHINTLSVFSLWAAKSAKVPVRIAHSHSVITNNKKEYKRNIIKKILRKFSKVFATDYCACSDSAAISQFGKKTFDNDEIRIVYNAIEIDKFKYNVNIRNKVRKELKIKDSCFVIGHVGRFVETKNQLFVLEVFNQYFHKNKNSCLLFVGKGPMLEVVKRKVENLGLQKKVIFLGQRNDIYNIYNTIDCFVFPSLYEGLGMSLIEAQINGIACLSSSAVPKEAKICDNLKFLSLEDNVELWTNKIKNTAERNGNISDSDLEKYDISLQAKKIEKYYSDLMEGINEKAIN